MMLVIAETNNCKNSWKEGQFSKKKKSSPYKKRVPNSNKPVSRRQPENR